MQIVLTRIFTDVVWTLLQGRERDMQAHSS